MPPTLSRPQAPQLQFSAYDMQLWSMMSYVRPSETIAVFFNEYPVKGTNWGFTPAMATIPGQPDDGARERYPYHPDDAGHPGGTAPLRRPDLGSARRRPW